jgi:hypothetical protein
VTWSQRWTHVAALLLCASSSSCGPSAGGNARAAPQRRSSNSAVRVPRDNGLTDGGWGVFEAPAQFVVVPLPDRAAWRTESSTGSWIVMTHSPSESELRITAWPQDVVSNRDRCERDGRAAHLGLPELEAEGIVEERVLDVPDGFDTVVRTSVRRVSNSRLEATAFAIGANVRRCLAVVFVTRSTGPEAERFVAERLRLVVDGSFARMRAWKIDDRASSQTPLFLR